jgi:trehalose 6-phosphate phosphatase
VAAPPERLAGWLRHPERSGVLTDFDGTIAPIVLDPASARLLPGTDAVLARLARRYALVAVVSGRPVAYLMEQLGHMPGLVLSGLYGLERARDGSVDESPEAAPWRGVVDSVAGAAEVAAPEGVGVERKGLSLALHYRTAPELRGWVEQWAATQAARTGLVAHPGKMSVELRPPVQGDKGTVVASLATGLDRVCFLGDDFGDLPAFAALAALAAAGVDTLAVAVDSAETPAELLAAADVVVEGPEGAQALLVTLSGC